MKTQILLALSLLLFSSSLFAQSDLFLFTGDEQISSAEKAAYFTQNKLEEGTLLRVDKGLFESIKKNGFEELTFSILSEGGKVVKMNVKRKNIFAEEFTVVARNGQDETTVPVNPGLHYFGHLPGYLNSIAGFSFFEDKIMGVFSYGGENYNLEKTKGDDDLYVMYRQRDFQLPLIMECGTSDDDAPQIPLPPGFEMPNEPVEKSMMTNVEIYIECDYQMYQDNGNNVTATTNFTTGLFNMVAGIYANAGGAGLGPTLLISQIVVWTTPDPYGATTATSSGPVLAAFSCMPTYNGRLAHLLSTSTQNLGGLANLTSCPMAGQYASAIYGFSNIANSYNTDLNVYSWSIDVFAHELGHNMSSRHSHACVWNGNNTQIDDCGNQWSQNNNNTPEGNACFDPNNPIIPAQGRIMSYCNLINGVGTNLAAGFDIQVGNQINNFASCLSTSITCPAAAPSDLFASNITETTARLNCSFTTGVSWYNFGYRTVGSNTWIYSPVIPTNYYDITGLQANTEYEFYIALFCTSGNWSAFSCKVTFSTTGGCPNNLAVNDDPILDGTYEAATEITSSGTVPANGNVVFSAGTSVVLEPNFNILPGGIFQVLMTGCVP